MNHDSIFVKFAFAVWIHIQKNTFIAVSCRAWSDDWAAAHFDASELNTAFTWGKVTYN